MSMRKHVMATGMLIALSGAAMMVVAQEGTQPPSTPRPGQPRDRYPVTQPPPRDTTTPTDRGLFQQGRPTQADIDRVSANWPQASKTALRDMTGKYGMPMAITPMAAVWGQNGPWYRTMVYGEEVQHQFPSPHTDVLLQFVKLKVPADKIGDLAKFDGSITAMRTAGLLGAFCDKEELNFLALNVANEIINGTRTPDDARQFFATEAANFKQGRGSTYTQGLMFEVERGQNTGDPDQPVTPGTTPGGLSPDRDRDRPGGIPPTTPPLPDRPRPSNPTSPGTPPMPGNPMPGEPRTPPTTPP